jgi:glycosyltransferase involved in cell wall biosynthesis
VRLAVWSPLPPDPSGVADYVAEQLAPLGRLLEVQVVAADPASVDRSRLPPLEVVGPPDANADLHLYHLGNSPSHAFAYRAARQRPGAVFLHEWNLHHLVRLETLGQGDVGGYLREMRRAHGEKGSFVARQVARGLGGEVFPGLLPLNEPVLERALAVVAVTRETAARAERRLAGRPVLALPHHFASPLDPVPSASEARRGLGLPQDAFLVTAPGLGTAAKRLPVLAGAVARLRDAGGRVLLVVAGELRAEAGLVEAARAAGLGDALRVTGRLSLPDFVRHLAAADVIAALRFPSHGEMSAALVRALGVGRPVLVTAGTAAAAEFPEGVVVGVTPGPQEGEELFALLARLREAPALRAAIAGLARDHVAAHHGIPETAARLADFLRSVAERKGVLAAGLGPAAEEDTLAAFFREEVQGAVRDLGLSRDWLPRDALFPEPAGGPR